MSSCTCYFICGFSNFMTKSKREQEHKTKKGNSFVEVNVYPATVCDYIPQTWNGLYERTFEEIEKQYSKGLKRWELFWQDLSRHLSNTMAKIILLLSSWRECCNLERKQCTIDITDKCQTMNWTHSLVTFLRKNVCRANMSLQTDHMNMKQYDSIKLSSRGLIKIEIQCVTEKWEGDLQWWINFYGNMDTLRSQLNVLYKAFKYFGQQSLCSVNNFFYFCLCTNSKCAPTENSWNMGPTAQACLLDLNFTTDWNPNKSAWATNWHNMHPSDHKAGIIVKQSIYRRNPEAHNKWIVFVFV